MTANEIREKFLDFFASKGHSVIASDSVVPKNDPTVLFTTAGMQQFKRQFLGQIDDYTRAASSQKCIRTDDLGEVGETAFHHTFFEMLGNFSFGDYFKKEAINWAWEFLTQHVNIPAEKLWVSVYKDDTEAEEIWLNEIGIPEEKLVKLGDKSNFWPSDAKQAGPNGPCGPCSEIFYDYGVNPDCTSQTCDPDCDCGRFSEIWNLVFTQFNRKDGGELEPLPNKNIDTGMGLERLTAVIQGKTTNFDTDLFMPVRQAIEAEAKKQKITLEPKSILIIADHLRAVTFAINDGVIPSNKERGSVVKRLIIDVTDHILRAGGKPFASKLVETVVNVMQEPYPELTKKQKDIAAYIAKAEQDYQKVYKTRIPELKDKVENAKDNPETVGQLMFEYRDTFGLTLPTIIATINDIAGSNLEPAKKVFNALMKEQQDRSRAGSKMAGDVFVDMDLNLDVEKTEFIGYDALTSEAKILKIFKDNQEAEAAEKGETVEIVLDQTPFYAESGGQIADTGVIKKGDALIQVNDTQKTADIFIHTGTVVSGSISVNDTVFAQVDQERRLDVMRNHTATHLLQAALRQVVGEHVQQQGSLVDDERLRFDFTHYKALAPDEMRKIEKIVNAQIYACVAVEKADMSINEAREKGALAFFAEKYGETVRVVSIGDFSTELCGGTHLDQTGQIGLIKITGETAIAQGIRRIEAKTGRGALALINEKEDQLAALSQLLKAPQDELVERVKAQTQKIKKIEKNLSQYRFDAFKGASDEIIENAEDINGINFISHIYNDADMNILRQLADLFKQKTKSSVIVLGAKASDSASILVTITDDLIKKGIKANELVKKIAPIIGGSGGGRPQMAQAGSKDASKLKDALHQAGEWLIANG
ncbi:MAG: alanine--tRNA ligase [Candidatus Omnitrophica bacterium]|nr:alanine--tRNA ligase [Candidatus Omnitrophota bacterium]